jgi:hypothetical protein
LNRCDIFVCDILFKIKSPEGSHLLFLVIWQDVDIFNKNLIEDPTKQLPGFDLPRKIWCKLNRFRTGHGKCNNMLFHWNIRENPSCECGAEKETIQHILEECPLTKFQQGFSKLHLLTEDALNWLQQIKNI